MTGLVKDLRRAGSAVLCRRVISTIFSQLASYSQLVMMDAMDAKEEEDRLMDSDPLALDKSGDETIMHYLCAAINDTGMLLDHTEQLEAIFADVLEGVSASKPGRNGPRHGGGDGDSGDDESAHPSSSLENDISRSKDSILASGMQLLGQWINMISKELEEPFERLFGNDWGPAGPSYKIKVKKKGEGPPADPMLVVCDTVESYLQDFLQLGGLDPYFFKKFTQVCCPCFFFLSPPLPPTYTLSVIFRNPLSP